MIWFFRLFLLPFALIYSLVILIRNLLFTLNIIPGCYPSIPVISVGNLSVGGTGKTPHVEYIAKYLLEQGFKIAIISRGYKRKSKGLLIANHNHTFLDLGDEPFQYFSKFKNNENIFIIVNNNRCKAIKYVLDNYPNVQVVLLDDAYQHRYVKKRLNILLTDYYYPFFKDYLIPLGKLREPRAATKRADIIIVTKSLKVISPLDKKYFIKNTKLKSNQKILFTYIDYHKPLHVLTNSTIDENKKFSTVFIVCAISNPYPFIEHCKKYSINQVHFLFPDHHTFTISDFEKIKKAFCNHISTNKVVFTTEKDRSRMLLPQLRKYLEELPIYFIPISVEESYPDEKILMKKIIDYVRANQANK